MDIRKLEVLMKAIEIGSFSAAAEEVSYTQSGLSHLADTIENELGISLIHRDRGGISLTPAGKKLFPSIQNLLSAHAGFEAALAALKESGGEVIRIAAYSSIAMHWMPEILYRFSRICPDVRVDLRMVDHALEPFELLAQGKTDIIFASRQSCPCDTWISLYSEKMMAILPKSYPLAGRTVFPLCEFSGLNFLMPYGRFDGDVALAMKGTGVTLHAKATHVDDETVIRMVGKGLGVSMMSELMIRGRTDDVLCVPVTPEATRELGMGICRNPSPSVPKLKACVLQFLSDNHHE